MSKVHFGLKFPSGSFESAARWTSAVEALQLDPPERRASQRALLGISAGQSPDVQPSNRFVVQPDDPDVPPFLNKVAMTEPM